jgi:acetate kinase
MSAMLIVVCNIGSSSFKFQLIDMRNESCLARGYVERVGCEDAIVSFWLNEEKISSTTLPVLSQREAVQKALDFISDDAHGLVISLDDIDGVGFKTIQAGEKNGSVLLDAEVLQAMEAYADLAPAHNPPYLQAIQMFAERLPETPLVGVFEPGFHVNAPEYAKVYGTPYEWIEKYGVRKYGYHGASHRYVTAETVKRCQLPEQHKVITCHLGGSSSLCAFRDGMAIDTSMGFTPQTGLIQGTRIGDMDPYVLTYIMQKTGKSLDQILSDCSKNGGLKGLSGISGDMRDILDAMEKGNARAKLAREKFIYDIKRYIGEFIVLLQGVDAITFTGGIGQRDADLRENVLSALEFLGFRLDAQANAMHKEIIHAQDSAFKALVLETNEEIVVARETAGVIDSL